MPRDKRKDNASVRKRYRPDKDGTHRLQFEHNKKIIFATQTVCALCGKPVDFSLKYQILGQQPLTTLFQSTKEDILVI